VYEKLKQEIRGRFKTSSEINSMAATFPYLTAVISEIMRLVPPMPFGTPRVVPEGGETVDGTWVPGGVCPTLSYPLPSFLPFRFLSSSRRLLPDADGMS